MEQLKDKVHILSSQGIEWYLYPKGKLCGYDTRKIPVYEFWVANPPDEHFKLFVAVCEFAVAQGLLEPIRIYAVVK